MSASLREIQEETGVTTLTFIKTLGSYSRYKIGLNPETEDTSEIKNITFFLFTTTQNNLQPDDPTHPVARWIDKHDVAALLTHPKDKAWFESIIHDLERL